MYFDRANNYWVAAVSLGYKAGKRVRRKVQGRTKTEVKAKLRDLRRDLDSGVRPSATYTVGAALDDWLANGLSGRSDRTKELYRDTVKPLRQRLGEVKLRELTAGDVQETLDALAGAAADPVPGACADAAGDERGVVLQAALLPAVTRRECSGLLNRRRAFPEGNERDRKCRSACF